MGERTEYSIGKTCSLKDGQPNIHMFSQMVFGGQIRVNEAKLKQIITCK